MLRGSRRKHVGPLAKLCVLIAFLRVSQSFVTVQLARPARGPSHENIVKRAAEAGTADLPVAEAAEQKVVEDAVSVVMGAERIQVPWKPGATCRDFRKSVEEVTEVPSGKQELKLANGELLGEGGEVRSDFEGPGAKLKTLWLVDLRTPAEKGEGEETIGEKLGTLWKLDNVSVLSIIVVIYTFFKELFPILANGGIKNAWIDGTQ
eukprot:TRINITY_DN109512_c0_g1_i1.p1 TRINITY_DN109512_c0_g1~~TRINITY_DN109512_c0_g1_i1.p1  ORF type:complete len:206 (+),score=50.35 TRINITY_DN109512_c0_g1_i1:48-665(+)